MLRFFEKQSPLCIAHRGASSVAPENTLAACELAASLGCLAWETDVCLSADGHPVCIHDDTLERTTDISLRSEFADRKPWPVRAFSLEELQRLDAGSWFLDADPFGLVARHAALSAAECARQHIPSLQQALEHTLQLNMGLNIELKAPGQGAGDQAATQLVRSVAKVVRANKAQEVCLLSSFSSLVLRLCQYAAPDLPRALLLDKRPLLLGRLVHQLTIVGAVAVHPKAGTLSPGQIGQLRKKGYLVTVWPVNERSAMEALAQAGASGVFTDFPQRCPRIVLPAA